MWRRDGAARDRGDPRQPPATADRVLAVIEVAGPAEEHVLSTPAGADVRWVHRGGAAAATTTHLADALRELPLPDGVGQAWGAAESTIARTLREVLRDERGMERKLVSAKGYWLRSGEWPDDEED